MTRGSKSDLGAFPDKLPLWLRTCGTKACTHWLIPAQNNLKELFKLKDRAQDSPLANTGIQEPVS